MLWRKTSGKLFHLQEIGDGKGDNYRIKYVTTEINDRWGYVSYHASVELSVNVFQQEQKLGCATNSFVNFHF